MRNQKKNEDYYEQIVILGCQFIFDNDCMWKCIGEKSIGINLRCHV